MSTSELRRGPGWWMDLNGQWNPPEEWPESNPPLPGWVRGADGFWYEPAITEADLEQPLDESDSATVERVTMRPVPDVGRPTTIPSLSTLRQSPDATATDLGSTDLGSTELGSNEHRPHLRIAPVAPSTTPSVGLSFSEVATGPSVFHGDIRLRRHAVIAALVTSVTASMLAAGLVLLLLLL